MLAEKIGATNLMFQEQLTRPLLMETKRTGEPLDEAVDRMVQWRRYNSAREKLNYPVASAQNSSSLKHGRMRTCGVERWSPAHLSQIQIATSKGEARMFNAVARSERAILGSILMDGDRAYQHCSRLRVEMLSLDSHRRIYQLMVDMPSGRIVA